MSFDTSWSRWRKRIVERCYGNWEAVAGRFCSNPAIDTLLSKKNVVCPECGRCEKLYIVDDYTLAAHCCSVTCSKHYYDGIALLAALNGVVQTKILKDIAQYYDIEDEPFEDSQNRHFLLNTVSSFQQKTVIKEVPKVINNFAQKERKTLLSMLTVLADDPLVFQYLQNRGLDTLGLPESIKEHLFFCEHLSYYKAILDDNDVVIEHERGNYPAMVAKVLDADFQLIGFHKTYLSRKGVKAKVSASKQLASSEYKGQYSENGAIIPLCAVRDGRYGIAEGIETSLAVLCMKRPCWSVLNANGIKTFKIPKDCKILDLYGDLDASGTGQQVIIEKYYQVTQERPDIKVNLYLPPEKFWNKTKDPKGIDFLDAYIADKQTLPAINF